MKPSVACLLLTAFCLVLSACSPKSAEPQPPEIAYGQDTCDACGMIISDAKFAAATLLTSGEATLTLGSDSMEAREGTWAHMPAQLPHSLLARTPVVMLLLLLKDGDRAAG